MSYWTQAHPDGWGAVARNDKGTVLFKRRCAQPHCRGFIKPSSPGKYCAKCRDKPHPAVDARIFC